jgi:hypothetical protein
MHQRATTSLIIGKLGPTILNKTVLILSFVFIHLSIGVNGKVLHKHGVDDGIVARNKKKKFTHLST